MKLYRVLDDDGHGKPQSELILSSDSVEELKERGRRLCREGGIENAAWIGSTESWQELSDNERVYYFIRP